MAKNIIEKPPFEYKYGLYDIFNAKNREYYHNYKEVDEKGRYLYWDQFRYRVKENDDSKIAWYATKIARVHGRKILHLNDKKDEYFSFSTPDSLSAKLYKIINLSREGIVPKNSIKQQYLIPSLLMEEAISSSQLEGASTTRRVAKDMLVSKRKPKSEDEQMIINNYLLMKKVKELKNEELSIDMILELHSIATQYTTHNGVIAGEFRDNNEIYIADGDDNVIYQPPCHSEIEKRVHQLCMFANSEHSGENNTAFINPVIKAIILHFMIGYIHPFSDGNGRTARALFYWFMLKNNFDYFEYISISKLLKVAPKKYSFSYLYSEIDDNDLNYFIYYQVDVILRAIDELIEHLKEKSEDFREILVMLDNTTIGNKLNFIQKDIVKKAIKNPGRIFTSNEIVVDYNISANSARKYLNSLVKYKILASYKDGKAVHYIAPANIKEMLNHKESNENR